MPVFQYKGIDVGGAARAGILDADSPREARMQLRSMHVHVTELEPLSALTVGSSRRFLPKFMQRRHREEIVLLTRQLGTMLRSGIPLASCLTAMVEQARERIDNYQRALRERPVEAPRPRDALVSEFERRLRERNRSRFDPRAAGFGRD